MTTSLANFLSSLVAGG
ncbi:MAG: photosystem II reaction center protein PsbX, partial [Gammaproteobacteria bacterium]